MSDKKELCTICDIIEKAKELPDDLRCEGVAIAGTTVGILSRSLLPTFEHFLAKLCDKHAMHVSFGVAANADILTEQQAEEKREELH